MIIKIKPGSTIKINGQKFVIKSVSQEDVGRNGASSRASIFAERDLESVEIGFDKWSIAINEGDLAGLAEMLTTG